MTFAGLHNPDLDRFIHGYFGKFRGIVTNNQDPHELFRVQVNVPSIHGSLEVSTGWALPCGSSLVFSLPELGDLVWVEFEEGDVDRPIWTAIPSFKTKRGHSNEPHQHNLYTEGDNSGGRVMENFGSAFSTDYGKLQSWTISDNRVELDGGENPRILIQHSSGSRIELLPDGTIEVFAGGNIATRVKGSEQTIIYGNSLTQYERDQAVKIIGNEVRQIDGDRGTYTAGTDATTSTKSTLTTDTLAVQVTGGKSETIGGNRNTSIVGDDSTIVLGKLQTIVSSILSAVNPLQKTLLLQNLTGSSSFVSGPNALGTAIDSSGIDVELSRVVIGALVEAVIYAPIVRIGPLGVPTTNNTVRGVPLLTWLNTHTHLVEGVSPSGPVTGTTLIPTLPADPLTLLSPTIFIP